MPAADIKRGDGRDFGGFIEATCRVTKDSVAAPSGSLLVLRGWQKHLVGHVFARRLDGRLRHRQALVGVARKNGKSGLGAGLGLAGLVLGPAGGEVYSCAADKAQAKVVFDMARRMVQMDPDLSGLLKVYRDVIEFEQTGSVYRALSAEAFTKEGLNPHLVVFDEVHAQPNRELWDVMALAMGSRVEPLMLGITTAGVRVDPTGADSLCFSMYEYGKAICRGEVVDPTFFMAWWEPNNVRADHRSPDVWAEANPGLGDLVALEDFHAMVSKTPESEFRTKRTNVFVSAAETWLPHGAWDSCADTTRTIEDGTKVVLSFDGSKTGDSTALTGITVEPQPHVFVVGCWEHPARDLDWRVPRADVKDTIRAACRRFDVVEVAWDDYMWQDAREELEDEGIPVEPFPQTAERMGAATQRFYEAVVGDLMTHSGDPQLARHVENAVLKPTQTGKSRIVKQHRNSKRWIDLAATAVMGLDRAAWWEANKPPGNLTRVSGLTRAY